ncbi:hypothetical protein VSP9026_04546 [Vibrio spartinae]|uniref:Uncharacterized protein n=1 Tax=Vibrio spartinae TaxID=1918945 RepID=A0A1N6MB91_9VIBR|nr:hypothetical protein VSP9026_04546 [Vibrio spartinae]
MQRELIIVGGGSALLIGELGDLVIGVVFIKAGLTARQHLFGQPPAAVIRQLGDALTVMTQPQPPQNIVAVTNHFPLRGGLIDQMTVAIPCQLVNATVRIGDFLNQAVVVVIISGGMAQRVALLGDMTPAVMPVTPHRFVLLHLSQ